MNSPNHSVLSPEDIKNLVYNPNSNSQSAEDSHVRDLERFKKVENPKLPFFSRSIPKLFIVGILACPVFLFALYFTSALGSSQKTTAQTLSASDDEQLEKDNESLRQQMDELQVQNAVLLQEYEELQAKKDQVKIVETKPEPKPEPVKIAKAEIKPQTPAIKPVESARPILQPEIEPIDPYEEWNKYASLGVITGDGFTEEEKTLEPETDNIASDKTAFLENRVQNQNSQLLAKAETKNSIPVVSLVNTENRPQENGLLSQEARNALFPEEPYDRSSGEEKTSNVSFASTDPNDDAGSYSNTEYQPQKNRPLSHDAQNALFPKESYNRLFLEAKRREYEQQDAANPNSTQQQSTETFLEAKRREYEQQDAANPNSTQQQSTETNLARCIDDCASLGSTNASNVVLGTQITGEVSQSISWIEGEQPQIRGVISLSEDLLADDGSIALRANSSIIVEIEQERNGQIDLSPIAVSYNDDRGKLVQQEIPQETFVIQDGKGSPLILKSSASDGEIPGQDVLLDLVGSQNRTSRRVVRELENLNDQNNSRPGTYELKQGTELTITVNSFLQI